MTGVAIVVNDAGLARLAARMARLALHDTDILLDAVGAAVEGQVRSRLSTDKSSPAGEAWPAWSEAYKQTRHGGQSLLESQGDLIDSIQYLVAGKSVEVGSNLVYAAIHNFGGTKSEFPHLWGDIPQREYLGLSPENERDIEAIVDDFVDGLAGAL